MISRKVRTEFEIDSKTTIAATFLPNRLQSTIGITTCSFPNVEALLLFAKLKRSNAGCCAGIEGSGIRAFHEQR
jgi:hypothetical protein